jgi:hypothetical protein
MKVKRLTLLIAILIASTVTAAEESYSDPEGGGGSSVSQPQRQPSSPNIRFLVNVFTI